MMPALMILLSMQLMLLQVWFGLSERAKFRILPVGLTNDLEYSAVSIVPQIARAKEALLAAGAVGVGMSGSGLQYSVLLIAGKKQKQSVTH